MFSKIALVLISPAAPSAILLYGIFFGFAMWSYLGWPWLRSDTIILYFSISTWALVVIVRRWRAVVSPLNWLDVLFWTFLLLVLGSISTHWWEGTVKYLEFMPCFFVLPFLLGRMMGVEDVLLFRKMLIRVGGGLLLLMPIEYWKNAQPGFLFTNSPGPILFGQTHGAMLSGLILSSTLLALISMLMVPAASTVGGIGDERRYRFFGYMMLALIVVAMIWTSSRGSAVAAVLAMIALLLFSSFCGWKKKNSDPVVCQLVYVRGAHVHISEYLS